MSKRVGVAGVVVGLIVGAAMAAATAGSKSDDKKNETAGPTTTAAPYTPTPADFTIQIIGIVLGVTVIAGVIALVVMKRQQAVMKRQQAALPPEVRDGITKAKRLREEWRSRTETFDKQVEATASDLNLIISAEGKRLKTVGGVTLYERWIATPQGAGSLIGVKAEATDQSYLQGRITVTRLVTLGVFALAAKKKQGGGNAYVVIEGPSVSGVATIRGDDKNTAGSEAFSFAAAINNVARLAEATEPGRPAAIDAASARLLAASDRTAVDTAGAAYAAAVAMLPAEHRLNFSDTPG